MPGGWNQRIPPGVARCTCPVRQERWARLSRRATEPCCGAACCRSAHAAIVSTRDDILALRRRCLREGWPCPRCGQPVERHQRNFECVDARTARVRRVKAAYGSIRSAVAAWARSQPGPR